MIICPYIVLDFIGDTGKCSNLSERESSDRYEVTNVEEFLERAAILIGRQYKGLAVISYETNSWYLIDNFINNYKEKIISIRDLPKGRSLSGGNILKNLRIKE